MAMPRSRYSLGSLLLLHLIIVTLGPLIWAGVRLFVGSPRVRFPRGFASQGPGRS